MFRRFFLLVVTIALLPIVLTESAGRGGHFTQKVSVPMEVVMTSEHANEIAVGWTVKKESL